MGAGGSHPGERSPGAPHAAICVNSFRSICMSCMSSTTMTVTSASMISDDPPYKLVFVFVCLCVYVDMCLYVVEPSGFRVLGFFRCLRRFLSINETSLSSSNRPLLSPRRRPGNTELYDSKGCAATSPGTGRCRAFIGSLLI